MTRPSASIEESGAGRGDRLARMLLVPLAALLVGILITFFVQYAAFQVDGPSMVPTLWHGERLLVTRGYPHPVRGDIVVFESPAGDSEVLVKRVVGVPGDRVAIDGELATVNGVTEQSGGLMLGGAPTRVDVFTVPADAVYVMGDNRAESHDSRYFGPVPLGSVRGKATAVFAPVTRMRALRDRPGTQ